MTLLDIYYRAFKDYRKNTADNSGCEKDRRSLAQSNVEQDKLEATKYLCNIEEDWIKAIEEGLVFVEKAVAEERQFIRTNGEVVPIEKVKKISKDSVEHLAKHSDMITHVPEEEDDLLVPDKLYMVEKLSDYAVYENRFLYMMLSYLKNFIEYRLEKIENLRRTYVGEMYINKEIATKKRTLRIETRVYEARSDNPYPIADEKTAALVGRIKDCQQIINSLLNTDLMQQVAKSPMIKPPIVKTNVLKMNNNFKRALALYDFIASYKGLGYSSEEVKYNFAPFNEKIADEIAEAANLSSFIAYKAGNDIDGLLETAYREEERRRKEEEENKLVQRIKRLKKRALESNKTMEEYMVLLEDRNRQLERDREELIALRQEVEALNRTIDGLNAEKAELERRIDELEQTIAEKEEEIEALKQQYIEDMAALKEEHEQELDDLAGEHEAEIEDLKAEFADKLSETIDEYDGKIDELNGEIENLNAEIDEANEKYEDAVADCENKIAEMQFKMSDFDNAQKRLSDEYEKKLSDLEEECNSKLKALDAANAKALKEARDETTFAKAELNGIRAEQGKLTPGDDYTSRERFVELENEYMAFHKFFKSQWEYTKKEIRKTILWTKQEKTQKSKRK